MKKRDYYIAGIIGFLVGILAMPTLWNLGLRDARILVVLVPVLSLAFALGVALGGVLARYVPFLTQFSKFAAVGFLSAGIDFAVLNILSHASGVVDGFVIGGFNIPGFALAVVNGYLWNELWVFARNTKEGVWHNFPKFLGVTLVGLVVNSVIIILITSSVQPLFGLKPAAWLNIAKIAANAVVLVWNFLGYKFVVFRK